MVGPQRLIVPFHNDFPPSGEQAGQHKLAHTLQLTGGCRAIFHKYCCYTKQGGIITNLNEIWRAYYWYVKIPQCGYMEHGLKDIAFYVQKHIRTRAVCHNFLCFATSHLGAPASVRRVYYRRKRRISFDTRVFYRSWSECSHIYRT